MREESPMKTPVEPKKQDINWKELKYLGYCVISRKYGMVSRIDRSDWKEHMAKEHSPWDINDGLKWIMCMGERDSEDQYRRCYSKDKLELGSGALRHLPNSGMTITGFTEGKLL